MTETCIDASRVVSNQALFDLAARHLFTQAQPALDKNTGLFRYRDAEGRTCAIGSRIPDSEYSEGLEKYRIQNVELRRAAAIPETQIELAKELQYVHDCLENWKTAASMKSHFRYVASMFDLSPVVLDALAFPDR